MRKLHPLVLAVAACLTTACGTAGLPQAALDHNARGAAHLVQGDLDDAEASFHLALEYHPRFVEAHVNLGVVALRRGDLPAAEEHLRAALRVNDETTQAWANLGVVLEARGALPGAEEAYVAALALDPGSTEPRRNLALLLVRRRRFREARAHLLRLVQITPADPVAQGALAWADLRLGRPDAAEARADRVLAGDAADPVARFVRGMARAGRGDLAGAIEDLEHATAHPDVGPHALRRLAAVYLLAERLTEAEGAIGALLARDPTDPAAHLLAGFLGLARGDLQVARAHARRALRHRPDLAPARALLARACAGDGAADGCPSPSP